jgi:hypothetical protein
MDGNDGIVEFGPHLGLVNKRFLGEIRGYRNLIFDGGILQAHLYASSPADWLESLSVVWLMDPQRPPLIAGVTDAVAMGGDLRWIITGPARTLEIDERLTSLRIREPGVYLLTRTDDLLRIEQMRSQTPDADAAASS